MTMRSEPGPGRPPAELYRAGAAEAPAAGLTGAEAPVMGLTDARTAAKASASDCGIAASGGG